MYARDVLLPPDERASGYGQASSKSETMQDVLGKDIRFSSVKDQQALGHSNSSKQKLRKEFGTATCCRSVTFSQIWTPRDPGNSDLRARHPQNKIGKDNIHLNASEESVSMICKASLAKEGVNTAETSSTKVKNCVNTSQ